VRSYSRAVAHMGLGVGHLMKQGEEELIGIAGSVDCDEPMTSARAGPVIAKPGPATTGDVDEDGKRIEQPGQRRESRLGSVTANIRERLIPDAECDGTTEGLVVRWGNVMHAVEAIRIVRGDSSCVGFHGFSAVLSMQARFSVWLGAFA
jgi:hypothetical protein